MDQIQVGSDIRNVPTSCKILTTMGFDERIQKASLSEDTHAVLLE